MARICWIYDIVKGKRWWWLEFVGSMTLLKEDVGDGYNFLDIYDVIIKEDVGDG